MRLATLILAACSLAACATTASTPAPTAAPEPVSRFTAIEISEGACFGTCPIYSIRITPDDQFVLDGERFTRHQGRSEGALAEGAFARIAEILDSHGADSMPAFITPDDRTACGPAIMSDMPSFVVTMERGDEQQSVTWYPGCARSPYRDAMNAITEQVRVEYNYSSRIAPKR